MIIRQKNDTISICVYNILFTCHELQIIITNNSHHFFFIHDIFMTISNNVMFKRVVPLSFHTGHHSGVVALFGPSDVLIKSVVPRFPILEC